MNYSTVNTVEDLAHACEHLDWHSVQRVLGEARANGATVTAQRTHNNIHLRVVAANTDSSHTLRGLHAKDADAILASLDYAGAEVLQ